jgi:Tfp pilus assembly protein PilF
MPARGGKLLLRGAEKIVFLAAWSLMIPMLAENCAAGLAQGTAPASGKEGSRSGAGAWFSRGEAALRNGDLDAAEIAFRHVLEQDPQAGGAYANLGVIAMRRKEWDKALRLLGRAETLEPKVAGIRLNIGVVKFRSGDYAGAIAPLKSVLRDQPDSQQAGYLLGLCDIFAEHYADAVAVLEPLWPQMSSNLMYLYALSMAAHRAGQSSLDEKAISQLVDIGGDAAEFHLILGKAYLNRRETEKAIDELEHAAGQNPNLAFVHLNLGIAYMRAGQSSQAEEEFRKEMAIEPDLADTYELLGEYYARAGNDNEAEKSFHEALLRNEMMPGSLFGLAKLYLRQEKYTQALTAIDTALKFAPNSPNVHFLRGRILTKLGRREEGEKELTRAAQMQNAIDVKANDPESFEDDRVGNPELRQEP